MNSNVKKIIIFSVSLVVLLGALVCAIIAFVIFKPFDLNKGRDKSQELKHYEEYYYLELDSKANEYYILGLKEEKQKESATLMIPEEIDGIKVTKIIDTEEDFSSFKFRSSIFISKNIKYIGTSYKDNSSYRTPFLLATGISNFEVDPENDYFSALDGVLYTKDTKTLIKFPASKSFGTGHYSYIIEDHVEVIGYKAFYQNANLEQIVFGENVKKVSNEAFSGCSKLEDVILNNSIVELGSSVFSNCSKLTEITLPKNLQSVGEKCFYQCKKLRHITVNCDIELNRVFTGITDLTIDPDTLEREITTIYFYVSKTESSDYEKICEKFTKVSYVNELGITGITGEEVVIKIYLNNIEGIIEGDTISYPNK